MCVGFIFEVIKKTDLFDIGHHTKSKILSTDEYWGELACRWTHTHTLCIDH